MGRGSLLAFRQAAVHPAKCSPALPCAPPAHLPPQAAATAKEERLKEALSKASRAAAEAGAQQAQRAQQAQHAQAPQPMSPRQAQLAQPPKLFPLFKQPAKKAAVAGAGGRPVAAPAPGLAPKQEQPQNADLSEVRGGWLGLEKVGLGFPRGAGGHQLGPSR